MVLAIFLCVPWLKQFVDRLCLKSPAARIVVDVLYLCLFILTVGYILSNGYAAFMYGEF